MVDKAYLREKAAVVLKKINQFEGRGQEVLVPGTVFRQLGVEFCRFANRSSFMLIAEPVECTIQPQTEGWEQEAFSFQFQRIAGIVGVDDIFRKDAVHAEHKVLPVNAYEKRLGKNEDRIGFASYRDEKITDAVRVTLTVRARIQDVPGQIVHYLPGLVFVFLEVDAHNKILLLCCTRSGFCFFYNRFPIDSFVLGKLNVFMVLLKFLFEIHKKLFEETGVAVSVAE